MPRWLEFGLVNRTGAKVWDLYFLKALPLAPRVFITDVREFADFHPSETLHQNQFLKVILLSKVKIFNRKSNYFIKQSFILGGHNYNKFSILAPSKQLCFFRNYHRDPNFYEN